MILGTILSDAVHASEGEPTRARVVWADFDGDSLEDLYVVRPEGQDSLLRNVGDGSFEDVTARALPCVTCASKEIAWRDVDADGRLDLLRTLVSGGVELLRNRGDGAFEDVTIAAGFEGISGVVGVRWLDYDADGKADVQFETVDMLLLYHGLGNFLFGAVDIEMVHPRVADYAADARLNPKGLDEGESPSDTESEPHTGPAKGPQTDLGPAALAGDLLAEAHPLPLGPAAPALDPLEPSPGTDFLIQPFVIRCANSVKDAGTGECVLTSKQPALGRLYPLSANLFVSPSGNVGMGTLTPAVKLEVVGTLRSTGFRMATGASANKVLTSDSAGNGTWQTPATIGGGGLVGELALFSATTTIGGSSAFADSLGNISVGGGLSVANALTVDASNGEVLHISDGSIHKGGALFIHTRGGVGTENNTAIGRTALDNVTTGDRNTASGFRALHFTTTGGSNTASGYEALVSNSTGFHNTATGSLALWRNTNGSFNTAHGAHALANNTTGRYNTACGSGALLSNATGYSSTALGNEALRFNTTGHSNTASGYQALAANTSGDDHTATGHRALFSNTTGNSNTAMGAGALFFNTFGNRNIALGVDAGRNLTNGDDNIAIGSTGVSGDSATIRIGSLGTHTRAFIAGIKGSSLGYGNSEMVFVNSLGQLGTVLSTQRVKENIADMGASTERLLDLRPVTFQYKAAMGEHSVEYGLIAEEVAKVFPDLVIHDENGDPLTVKYHLLASMLLNELKKNDARDRERERELAMMREKLADLESLSPCALPASMPEGDL